MAEELHFDSNRFASEQKIGSLSGGEALKVQLIHELSKPFEVLFLDEPSNEFFLLLYQIVGGYFRFLQALEYLFKRKRLDFSQCH